jgi:hypothetical protein
MKSFLTRHDLDATDVRDFVIIVLFIGTLAVLAALGSGA